MKRHWRRQALREGRGDRELLNRVVDLEDAVANIEFGSRVMLWLQIPPLFIAVLIIAIMMITSGGNIAEALSSGTDANALYDEVVDYRDTI